MTLRVVDPGIALTDQRIRRFLARTREARDPTDRGSGVDGGAQAAEGSGRRRIASLDRAVVLADALGGWVERAPSGNVVVVESSTWLPLEAQRLRHLPYPVDTDRPLVCLDTETTGLGTGAGTFPFLVGLGVWQGDRMTVWQVLLPEQPDEPALLSLLDSLLPQGAWLVTYNGRSFDWPLITARYRLHGRSPPPLAGHLDLLPVARQLWRHRLADARLASVEAGIAGVRREGDLPGSLIPDRYLGFLRTGDGWGLRDVARHNLQDIVSLGLLLAYLVERMSDVEARRGAHPGDLSGLAQAYARRRAYGEALECWDAAVEALSDPRWPSGTMHADVHVRRARLLARMGRREDAHGAWLDLARGGGPGSGLGWIQVAKHREHVARDLPAALDAARRAQEWSAMRRMIGRPDRIVECDLPRRIDRLTRRAGPRAPPPAR